MKTVLFTVTFVLLMLVLYSCTKSDAISTGPENSSASSSEQLLPNLDSFVNKEEKFVVVLLGYGYNEGSQKNMLLSQLDTKYGLAENGGIIIPFVYPDDFVSFGYERISLMLENIQNKLFELTGESDISAVSTLVTLGAPEQTHFALAALQDASENLRIFSVFSQDDILGTESGSTLVIDYSLRQSEQQEDYETLGELDLTYPSDVYDVIEPLINAGLDWTRVDSTGLFIPALRSEYAKRTMYNLFVYIDPQTGLRAENHFVLTQKE